MNCSISPPRHTPP